MFRWKRSRTKLSEQCPLLAPAFFVPEIPWGAAPNGVGEPNQPRSLTRRAHFPNPLNMRTLLKSLTLCSLLTLPACLPATQTDSGQNCITPSSEGRALAFRPDATTLAFVGDVLPHILLQEDAANQPDGYAAQFTHVAPYLTMADLTVANLESPTAAGVLPSGRATTPPSRLFDGQIYSGYPTFNAHPSLITALSGAGIDLLQTANNHALDRGPLGIDRTLSAIGDAGLNHTGSRPQSSNQPFHRTLSVNGQSISFLACSYDTNGRADPHAQVLLCYSAQPSIPERIRSLSQTSDAVILLPHWGSEYSHTPTERQRTLARAAIEAGATAVIGTHPHVLQPIETHTTAEGRTGLIAYSLGNFISSQWSLAQRSSAILYLDLIPDASGRLQAAAPAYLPTRVTRYTSGVVVQPAEQAVSGNETLSHTARILGADAQLSLADIARLQGRPICVTP